MSDRFPAQIRIGGTIDRTTDSKSNPEESALDMLISMINGAEVSHEYGDVVAEIPVSEGDDDDSQLLQYLDDDTGCLQFRDDQAVNGELPELEEFLREHDIPYSRCSSAYGGWLGEEVYWVPGMREPLVIYCDDHGTDYVSRDDVRTFLERLKNEQISYQARTKNAATDLQSLCPDRPEIPPFKIVGEKA